MIFSSLFSEGGAFPFIREGVTTDLFYQDMLGYKEPTQRELLGKAVTNPSEYVRRIRKKLRAVLLEETSNSVGNDFKLSECTTGFKRAASQLKYHPCNPRNPNTEVSAEWIKIGRPD